MDPISKNKQLLRGVFKTFDTKGNSISAITKIKSMLLNFTLLV
jgi:hypothetical protein